MQRRAGWPKETGYTYMWSFVLCTRYVQKTPAIGQWLHGSAWSSSHTCQLCFTQASIAAWLQFACFDQASLCGLWGRTLLTHAPFWFARQMYELGGKYNLASVWLKSSEHAARFFKNVKPDKGCWGFPTTGTLPPCKYFTLVDGMIMMIKESLRLATTTKMPKTLLLKSLLE